MLAIVEHKQDMLSAQRAGHTLGCGGAGDDFEAKCGRDGGRNEVGVGERREFGGPDSVRELRQQSAGSLEGESRLADAAGAGEGDEPMLSGKLHDLPQFVIPADQFGDLLRYIGRWHGGLRLRSGPHRAHTLCLRARTVDFASELVAASGDRPDQRAIRPQGSAQR